MGSLLLLGGGRQRDGEYKQMGNTLMRNRFWWYRSLYDDYITREFRLAFGMAGLIYLPMYWWGIHFNREIEVKISHKNYVREFLPKRNRLTHSMLFEEFEMIVERWQDLADEYAQKGALMWEGEEAQAKENE